VRCDDGLTGRTEDQYIPFIWHRNDASDAADNHNYAIIRRNALLDIRFDLERRLEIYRRNALLDIRFDQPTKSDLYKSCREPPFKATKNEQRNPYELEVRRTFTIYRMPLYFSSE